MTNLADLRYDLLLDLLRSRFPSAVTAHVIVRPTSWYKVASVRRVVDAEGRNLTPAPGNHLGDDEEEVNELICDLFPTYRSYITPDLDDGPITDAGEECILHLDE